MTNPDARRPWLALYPPGVPAEIDPGKLPTLARHFEEAFARHAAVPLALFLDRSYSYGHYDRASRALAAWLAARGVERGDRVAIMMPNVPQYLAAIAGIVRAGAVIVNVNPLYTAREVEQVLADSGAVAIVVLENFAATVTGVLPGTKLRHVLVAAVGDWLGPVKGAVANFVMRHVRRAVRPYAAPGVVRFDAALAEGARLPFAAPAIAPGDLAVIQYTGGTTGVAKGAMLTHANLGAAVLAAEAWLAPATSAPGWPANPTFVCALPLFHMYALMACVLLAMRLGGKSLLIANPRDLDALVRDLKRHPPHAFPAVNTLYRALLDHPGFGRIDFSGLRVANSGGMAVQRAVAERWFARTGCPIVEGWGLTEASAAVTLNRLDIDGFTGDVGVPLPSFDLALRDEEGREVAAGEPGEIVVRGPQVMAGYWRNPGETSKVMTADGWLRTGDIGVLDAAGRLRIVDRLKDMIDVSGFKVFPNEVEDVAVMHPGVREAAVVGVPDERTGEAVKLFVVPGDSPPSAEELAAFLRERLTNYKRPRHIVFVPSLPKTPVGKILRRALRE